MEITNRLHAIGVDVKAVGQDAGFVVKEPKTMLKKVVT
jgi:hypothetical protein